MEETICAFLRTGAWEVVGCADTFVLMRRRKGPAAAIEDTAAGIEAVRRLLERMRRIPFPDSLIGSALSLAVAGRREEAIAVLKRAADSFPEWGLPCEKLGELYADARDAAQALGWAKRAVLLRPRSPRYRLTLARAHELAGDWEAAKAHYRRAGALYPAGHEFRVALARLCMRESRPDRAVPHLRRVVRDEPDFAEARAMLAACYAALGMTEEAREECRRVLAGEMRESTRVKVEGLLRLLGSDSNGR